MSHSQTKFYITLECYCLNRVRINVTPGVNFINVLRAHFLYKILVPKITKLCLGLDFLAPKFCTKNARIKCWWNWWQCFFNLFQAAQQMKSYLSIWLNLDPQNSANSRILKEPCTELAEPRLKTLCYTDMLGNFVCLPKNIFCVSIMELSASIPQRYIK